MRVLARVKRYATDGESSATRSTKHAAGTLTAERGTRGADIACNNCGDDYANAERDDAYDYGDYDYADCCGDGRDGGHYDGDGNYGGGGGHYPELPCTC